MFCPQVCGSWRVQRHHNSHSDAYTPVQPNNSTGVQRSTAFAHKARLVILTRRSDRTDKRVSASPHNRTRTKQSHQSKSRHPPTSTSFREITFGHVRRHNLPAHVGFGAFVLGSQIRVGRVLAPVVAELHCRGGVRSCNLDVAIYYHRSHSAQ